MTDPQDIPYEVCGFVGEAVMYRMSITADEFARLVMLSKEGVAGLPDWLDLGPDTRLRHRLIGTTDPGYFDDTKKEQTHDAYNRADQAGFGQL